MSSNNYNYPEIHKGIGELSVSMWSRIMAMLRSYESRDEDVLGNISNAALNSRITDLEIHKPYFFAKLLRAHVLDDETLQSPNTYEYAWCEVRPYSQAPDCCPPCIESRHWADTDWFQAGCCATHTDCETYLNFQGHWNWWENIENTSWGNTLPATGFELYDLKSQFNPDGYPCILDSCNVNGGGDYPDRFTAPYTKPAMNILEAFNTADNAGGVDQTKGIGDFMLQAIGGGDTQYDGVPIGEYDSTLPQCWDPDLYQPPCTQFEFPLKTTPIVLMFNIRETDGTFRQVFQAANSYDGTCVAC